MAETRPLGTDVSRWEGVINFTKMQGAGAKYVYCKASQIYADSMFATYWKDAKAAGILRGAYHYIDWRKSELEQAKMFINLIKADPGELPPVIDLEMNPAPYELTAAQVSGKVWNFLTAVEAAIQRVPMIYVGYYYWNSWGSNNINWARFPMWLPWYAPEWYIKWRTGGGTGAPAPWKNWTFWQYTDRGYGPTYGAQAQMIDLNLFNGTEQDLYNFAKVSPVPPEPDTNILYYVNCASLKVFAGPADTYRQVSYPLVQGTKVMVMDIITDSRGEKWAQIESPAGWVRYAYLTKV